MYSIIYGRLAGKHKVEYDFETDSNGKKYGYTRADFIAEYNLDITDESVFEGFQTFSVVFKEEQAKYEDLLMDRMYFLLTDSTDHVLYFEEVSRENLWIEITVGEGSLDWFTAPQVSCEYPELPEP
ncbi:MAG: hypothetical protein UFA98_04850 [Ruminococcus sp.]|nr:hypothetical protein [Ruminococcus sp.]